MLLDGPKNKDFQTLFCRKGEQTNSCRKGLRYYKYNSFEGFSMFTRHTETHLKLHLRDAQKLSKNDGQIIEKTNVNQSKDGTSRKRCTKVVPGRPGASFWEHFGKPKLAQSPSKPRPDGLKRVPEGHAPAQQASQSQSGPTEAEKRVAEGPVTELGFSHRSADHSGYPKG